MRGRVLILVGLIVLGGVVIAAVLLLGGEEETPDTTPQPTTVGGDTVDSGTDGDDTNGGTTDPQPTTAPSNENLLPVVVAVRDLPRGTLITADMVEAGDETADPARIRVSVRFWPEALTPQTVIDDPTSLIGCRIRTDIPVETPIVVGHLAKDARADAANYYSPDAACAAVDNQFSRIGSDAALGLDPDTVGISVPLDFTGLGQVAYGIKPGDRVDVIMSFLFIDVDEEFQTRRPNSITVITRLPDGSIGFTEGRPGNAEPSNIFPEGVIVGPGEPQQRPRLETQRTVTNAKVIWVGWFPPDGNIYGVTPTPFELPTVPPPPSDDEQQSSAPPTPAGPSPTSFTPVIMTLGVTPQDALVLTWAIDAEIPITYTLRPANPDPTVDEQTEAVTLEYILDEFVIEEPPNLPISVEPAITDIRRFDLSSLRTFAELLLG